MKKLIQTIQENAEISRLLYIKDQDLEIKGYKLGVKEEVLSKWEIRLRKREISVAKRRDRLTTYEANLKKNVKK